MENSQINTKMLEGIIIIMIMLSTHILYERQNNLTDDS